MDNENKESNEVAPPTTQGLTKNEFSQSDLCCPTPLSCALAAFFPLCWIGCTTINEREEAVMLTWGKYTTTITEPGCYCYNSCGISQRTVSTARTAIDLANVKVADKKGNPLLISGVVTYELRDARKAALDVQDVVNFIRTQGLTVMKRIASMYPYESKGHEPSLKTEADAIRNQMVQFLQERVLPAGVHVVSFELNDLAYAPEIASNMLIRQQAEAVVDARKTIVEGAVEICHDALVGLGQKGIRMSEAEQSRLVSNLLVTICGEHSVQPTISLSENGKH